MLPFSFFNKIASSLHDYFLNYLIASLVIFTKGTPMTVDDTSWLVRKLVVI